MLSYSQTNRLMKVTSPLGPNVLLVNSFRGREAVSELYHFTLELLVKRPLSASFDKLLGQPLGVEIALPNRLTRKFHGIVSCFTQTGQDDTFNQYEAELVPKPWLMTRRAGSRIFQQKNVAEILSELLVDFEHSLELSVEYPRRNFTVQYNETDFDFACRLMEEEGIGYFFRHEDDRHEMVLFDNSLQLSELPTAKSVVYEQVSEGIRDDVRVTGWKKSQVICSSATTLWDHTFQLPGQHLDSTQAVSSSAEIGQVEHHLPGSDARLEHYEYPGGYARWFDGVNPGGAARPEDPPRTFEQNERIATVRMQERTAAAFDITGESNCLPFCPGFKFSLERHFDSNDKYLLCSVEHEARLASGYRSDDQAPQLEYSNRFSCLPDSLPFRPVRNTRQPIIHGVQTATVVGPEDSELFIDKYGRVKIQFHWDREGTQDGNSSCWVRVSQIWAGATWGAFFWPRVGHEVVVAFEGGNPDQPLIVGSVYNAKNMPPVDLPNEKMVGGIKSKIFSGDPSKNFNAICIHDSPGTEYVQIHSEKNEVSNSETNKFHFVSGAHVTLCGSF
jgi:type VI secretion system secreted protein VgrG